MIPAFNEASAIGPVLLILLSVVIFPIGLVSEQVSPLHFEGRGQ